MVNNRIKVFVIKLFLIIIFIGITPAYAIETGELVDPINYVGSDSLNGEIKLTKTVSIVDSDEGIYNIKFDLTSKDAIVTNTKTNPLYVAIVFDTSGSMCEENMDKCGDKWKNAVDGAIGFSKELLKNNNDAKIALINFSSGAGLKRDFDNKILTTNDFLNPEGGTNIALGLTTAKNLFDEVDDDAKKIIVLMTDGEPQVYTNLITDYLAIAETKIVAESIYELGIELFAVGYDTTESNSKFLKNIVTSPESKYYSSGEISDIKTKFNNIVTDISQYPAGTNIVITDVIGDDFNYVLESASDGVIIDGKSVIKKLEKTTQEVQSFEFNIKINKNIETGWHNTNSNAQISYIDSLGEEVTMKFEKSSKVYWEVPIYNYIINYYKDEIKEENLISKIEASESLNREIIIDVKHKIPEGYYYDGEIPTFIIKENNNEFNVIYSKKNNLTYCVNYFYEGIIDINNTDCYYDQTYGKEISSFIDKPRDGYIFDNFEPIVVLDIEENIMNVYYKEVASGEITPPITGINDNSIVTIGIMFGILTMGIIIKKCTN